MLLTTLLELLLRLLVVHKAKPQGAEVPQEVSIVLLLLKWSLKGTVSLRLKIDGSHFDGLVFSCTRHVHVSIPLIRSSCKQPPILLQPSTHAINHSNGHIFFSVYSLLPFCSTKSNSAELQ